MTTFKFGTKNKINVSSANMRNPILKPKTKMNHFKNLTIGRLITTILSVLIISNFIIVSLINGIPYKEEYENTTFWNQITGVSFGVFLFLLFCGLIYYIVENWNTKIFKNE